MAAIADRVDLAEPFRGTCPICAVEVVVVELAGEDVVLEVLEILATVRCPRCASNVSQGKLGQRRTDPKRFGGLSEAKPCWRCGGTRVVGEELPSIGIRVDERGLARPFTGEREPGEAVHVFHACSVDADPA